MVRLCLSSDMALSGTLGSLGTKQKIGHKELQLSMVLDAIYGLLGTTGIKNPDSTRGLGHWAPPR